MHVAKCYELHGIVDTHDYTCAVSRYFVLLRYTAVYRDLDDTGIVGVRRVGIDDKYRGIVGIAQHYYAVLHLFSIRLNNCYIIWHLFSGTFP